MSAPSDFEARTIKAKRAVPQPGPAQNAPMTSFFLRTEAELDKSMQDNGLDMNSSASSFVDDASSTASVADTAYGVQSLDDAMRISTDSLSRISSNESSTQSTLAGRRRRPGNPVHPKIFATGQRIVSSEHTAAHTSESPQRTHARRTSNTSSAHLTPLNMSPHPDGALPGTPRTNSIRSFRLSDEETSVTSDTGSQAIQSSSEEEDVPPTAALLSPSPQLVMPSITMPKRRPFTQRGRSMGQLKVMVAGACGIGKTSLLRNIFRLCEDIVHIDGITGSTPSLSTATSKSSGIQPTTTISELQASTRPLPAWWSDLESSRTWWRRKSFGDGVLERNLKFIDTPGVDSDSIAQRLLKEINTWYEPIMSIDSLADNQLFALLSSKSDIHLDAVLYLFDAEDRAIANEELSLIHEISTRTNLIPLIARSDTVDSDALEARRTDLLNILTAANIDLCSLNPIETTHGLPILPNAGHDIYAISSLADDSDIMDASTLMASAYLPPLAPSELQPFISRLLDPTTIERLRHQSTAKLLSYRRRQLSCGSLLPQLQLQPQQDNSGLLSEPSKALVPHAYSSYYRSSSPSSDASGPAFGQSDSLPQHQQSCARPSRHGHVAKWARDLQRSFAGQRWQDEHTARPLKGRLGGDLAIIDPKDPLGILSMTQGFGRRGLLALQIVGGCGLLSAAVWWLARNYFEWQSWFWPGQDSYFSAVALPAPTRSWLDSVKLV